MNSQLTDLRAKVTAFELQLTSMSNMLMAIGVSKTGSAGKPGIKAEPQLVQYDSKTSAVSDGPVTHIAVQGESPTS
jgi:hypothetical protein